MKSLTLTLLSLFLGGFFVFAGWLKVSPSVNREMHREIRKNFVKYAKVFPFSSLIGFKVSPKSYRMIFGYTEIAAGLLLAWIPGIIKQIANIVLLLQSLLALYTHSLVENKFERIAPSIVFTLMLICRLVVYWQVRKRTAIKAQERVKQD